METSVRKFGMYYVVHVTCVKYRQHIWMIVLFTHYPQYFLGNKNILIYLYLYFLIQLKNHLNKFIF